MKNRIISRTLMRNSSSRAGRPLRLRYLKLLVSLAFCFLAGSLSAQSASPAPASATITFANGESITVGSNEQQIFNPVDLLPGEAPGIQLQLPPSFINNPVGIQPMDGGVTPEEIQVNEEGSTTFVFQSGAQPGLYRILLRTADSAVLLQFFIPNPGTP